MAQDAAVDSPTHSSNGGKWVLPKMEFGLEPPERNDDGFKFKPSFWPADSSTGSSFRNKILLLLPDQRRDLYYMKTKKGVDVGGQADRERGRAERLAQKESAGSTGDMQSSYESKMTLKRLALSAKCKDSVLMEESLLKPYRESAVRYNNLMSRFASSDLNPQKEKKDKTRRGSMKNVAFEELGEKFPHESYGCNPRDSEAGIEGNEKENDGGGLFIGTIAQATLNLTLSTNASSYATPTVTPKLNSSPRPPSLAPPMLLIDTATPRGDKDNKGRSSPRSDRSSPRPDLTKNSSSGFEETERQRSPRANNIKNTESHIIRVQSYIVIVRLFRLLRKMKKFVTNVRVFLGKNSVKWQAMLTIWSHWKAYMNVITGKALSRNIWLNVLYKSREEGRSVRIERAEAAGMIVKFTRSLKQGLRYVIKNYLKSVRKIQFFVRKHLLRNQGKREMLGMLMDRFIVAVIPSVSAVLNLSPTGMDIAMNTAETAALAKQLSVNCDIRHQVLQSIVTPEFHTYLRTNSAQVKVFYGAYKLSNGRQMSIEKKKSILLSGIFTKRRVMNKKIDIEKSLLKLPIYTSSDAEALLESGFDKLTTNIKDFLAQKEEEHKNRHSVHYLKHKAGIGGLHLYFCNLFSTLTPMEMMDMLIKIYDPSYTDIYIIKKKTARSMRSSMISFQRSAPSVSSNLGTIEDNNEVGVEKGGSRGVSRAESRLDPRGSEGRQSNDGLNSTSAGRGGGMDENFDKFSLTPTAPSKEKGSKGAHSLRKVSSFKESA